MGQWLIWFIPFSNQIKKEKENEFLWLEKKKQLSF